MADVETAPAAPDLSPCGHDLLVDESRRRGFCEACRIDRRLPVKPYDYRRIPNPGPKLRAAMEEMGDHV